VSNAAAIPFERDIVIVSGSDAGEYLQTQLTQDVLSLGVGESRWSFLLRPKSEIIALLRVTRDGPDRFLLRVEPGWGDVVRQTIDEFLFRMDVSFEQTTEMAEGVVDVVGPGAELRLESDALNAEDLERVRIASGWPRMGTEIDDSVTPAMTGLISETVAFDKGCYTGQEFVARVHYREVEPPKRLIRLAFTEDAAVLAGDSIAVEGDVVGNVTSAARGVALGYLKRGYDTPSVGMVGDVEVEMLASEQP
jgi:hypothetical protein